MAEDPAYLETRLTSLRSAITAIEGGAQSFSVLGRTYERGQLAEYYQQEERLLARLAKAQRGGGSRIRLGLYTPS